ncbi:hypothetical protein GOP47_0018428 [Adiantum capillus-veneris]|uniref:Uncharacterized protein n=1 Tax=Adiantum capillus-veneris TaxID=13818 RepID=A0A9D4UEF5_ADICA|nr:hypothetical protein GOP47_0018428 [Adiantum capillus-veneris]
MGILKDQEIVIASLKIRVNLVVLKIEFDNDSYPMLLGRPWFRKTKLKSNWGSNDVRIKQGKKKVRFPMTREVRLQQLNIPLWAQAISLATKVEDLEEEEFLLANSSMELVFDIDAIKILGLKTIISEGESDQVLPGTVIAKGEFLVLEKK